MPTPSCRDAIRVASIPAGHPYVTGLGLDGAQVRLLADPPVPGAPPGQWWPPVMLGAGWIPEHADAFDVMHVHFGVESLSPASLGHALRSLRLAGRPLVYTVHDLTHPQLGAEDQARHLAQLDLLIPAADALITLTPAAASEIESRWGRSVHVIAHPAMLRRDSPVALPGPGAVPVVGVHLRDLRPGIDGPGSVAELSGALERLPGVHGRVWLHEHVRDPAAATQVQHICEATPQLELIRGPRPDDAALEAQLAGLAVSMLPYRHGTHSGWVELCWDLGVPVAGPAFGHFADQHSDPSAYRRFDPGDRASLARALAALLTAPAAAPGSAARASAIAAAANARARDRPGIASAHGAVYRSVL